MPCDPVDAFDLQLPPSRAATEQFRAAFRAWLRSIGASNREAFDILTATGEAIANAIEHPQHASSSLVALTASSADGQLTISVHDFGTWQAEQLNTDRGHGFTLMRALMDTIDVTHNLGGTTVVMTSRLRSCSRT